MERFPVLLISCINVNFWCCGTDTIRSPRVCQSEESSANTYRMHMPPQPRDDYTRKRFYPAHHSVTRGKVVQKASAETPREYTKVKNVNDLNGTCITVELGRGSRRSVSPIFFCEMIRRYWGGGARLLSIPAATSARTIPNYGRPFTIVAQMYPLTGASRKY